MIWNRRENAARGAQALERALGAWRSALEKPGRLSDEARSRILDGALNPPARETAAGLPLFVPARRLALAAIVPAALGLLLALLVTGHSGNLAGRIGPKIVASKQNGQVVFSIANGKRAHYVYRSSAPNRIGTGSPEKVVGGVFTDTMAGGPDIVFYRVD